jgi:deazaflavin-dependent oxidoreductase (nitroreductase family)
MTEPHARDIDLSLRGDEHVRVYRETNGERGYLWNGSPILLLTTKGRRSAKERTIPLIFTVWGDSWAVIASRGGSPTHPAWYLNLREEPHVGVQIKANAYHAVARTAPSPERERIWAEAIKHWPSYDLYQSRAARQIPVVVLDPVKEL